MTPLQAAILGLVEGLTEYLPVSSTGHLILTSALLGLDRTPESKRAVDAFQIVIQGGAILAVLGLYWPRIVQMLRGVMGRDAAGRRLLVNLLIAFIPAAGLGLALKDLIERELFHPGPVLAALAVGGVIMIIIARWQRRVYHEPAAGSDAHAHRLGDHVFLDIDQLTWMHALIIGLFQCFALWPGTSRSMATIVGGMVVGLKPRHAAEFSFLLALPTLGGACIYSAIKERESLQTFGVAPIAIGIVVAAVSAAVAVRFFVGFLNRHGLALFGWYRLGLCALMWLLIWRGFVQFN